MKKLKQWINTRRDRRLRKWCLKFMKNQNCFNVDMRIAQEVYDWVEVTTTSARPDHIKIKESDIKLFNEGRMTT